MMSEFRLPETAAFDAVVDDLVQRGWSVCPGLLPAPLAQALEQRCRWLWQSDALTPAAIGRGSDEQVISEIRGDHTRWLEQCPPHPAQQAYLQLADSLREALNRSLFLGLESFETHYALYPPGSGYRTHLDRFRDSPLRTVTLVSYLNSGWQPELGGQLRLHLPGQTLDVQPLSGTMVVFMSDRILHEVLPAQAERASLTGWFRRRPDNPLQW